MALSRAFDGGKEQYPIEMRPETDEEVLELVQEFIEARFSDSAIADEIARDFNDSDSGNFICVFADDGEESNMLFTVDGELVAYGLFVYLASNDSVQTIWQNKFEVRVRDGEVVVNVSDWFGPTVSSWRDEYQELQWKK